MKLNQLKDSDLHNEIGYCSEIINRSVKMKNKKLTSVMIKHVSDYRQELRTEDDKRQLLMVEANEKLMRP